MVRRSVASLISLLVCIATVSTSGQSVTLKQASALYPEPVIAKARRNIERYEWAKAIQKKIVEAARPWRDMSDDELWNLMFSPTIKRSWMVWSNGYCPSCKKSVPMYTWVMDALGHPWKTRCPNCKQLFPKNDFCAFYRSGLDAHGTFDPARADRSLLFNAEHPDAADPLRSFGVDDGEGYVDGDKRWRFIGAYLIFGQWKQGMVAGIRNLAEAYVVTGDQVYAHKAAVLLDRVADLYPDFDFGKQGVMYEGPPRDGYISTWHDACVEVRDLAIAYDQVFAAVRDDKELIAFLSGKARRFQIDNAKTTFADIQRNIEQRILLDTIEHRQKIESNYPQTDISIVLCKTVLNWPANREEVLKLIDAFVEKSTVVDGLTGEKGLAGYTALPPRYLAEFFGHYTRSDPSFLPEMIRRHPRLHDMYRFHIDTWCLENYYPESGDTGTFAHPVGSYVALSIEKTAGLHPSAADFLWRLFEVTKDVDFVKVLYHDNGNSVEGLPYDLFADDPAVFQMNARQVIEREGVSLDLKSVNKQQWHLAILRSGKGKDARAAWLDYDSGERHSHHDGMTLGLFAKGLDLLPDFGYPPVQFGGWGAPRAVWYTMTAAHNTVMVNGQNTRDGDGRTTLWADGEQFHAIRASGPALIGGQRYERTVLMTDVSERDFYLVDLFRVAGGTDHIQFIRSHFGTITPHDLSLRPGEAPPGITSAMQMRGFHRDSSPPPVWSVDWKIEDRYKLLAADADVHLRCTDLTGPAEVYTAESWVSDGYSAVDNLWIPTLLVHRHAAQAPLTSTFVSVIEPYEKSSSIVAVRRLVPRTTTSNPSSSSVALEVELTDGSHDVFLSRDMEASATTEGAQSPVLALKEFGLQFEGDVCWIRFGREHDLRRIGVCHTSNLRVGDVSMELRPQTEFVELSFDADRAGLITGDPKQIVDVQRAGRSIWVK